MTCRCKLLESLIKRSLSLAYPCNTEAVCWELLKSTTTNPSFKLNLFLVLRLYGSVVNSKAPVRTA